MRHMKSTQAKPKKKMIGFYADKEIQSRIAGLQKRFNEKHGMRIGVSEVIRQAVAVAWNSERES